MIHIHTYVRIYTILAHTHTYENEDELDFVENKNHNGVADDFVDWV